MLGKLNKIKNMRVFTTRIFFRNAYHGLSWVRGGKVKMKKIIVAAIILCAALLFSCNTDKTDLEVGDSMASDTPATTEYIILAKMFPPLRLSDLIWHQI
jgi:hypothetical protein